MKYAHSIILFLFLSLSVFSQTPEKMSYQAVLRASDYSLVSDSNVSLKVLIRQDSPDGPVIFEETHQTTTNANGLVSLEIGSGSADIGSFSDIAWESGTYYVETQTDVTGGSNYSIIGVSQLLSVPYALHAKSADTITGSVTVARALVIDFTESRSVLSSDIHNTIACTRDAIYTLSTNFTAMAIGDTINLEAHNGATLTVQADSGVTLNYVASGTGTFASTSGNVRFGMLRKSGDNAYIISGQ